MPEIRFTLLGAPRLEGNGKPIEVDTRKALALLAYILLEDQPQSRDTLAALLWPESDQSSARAALRRTLSTLRKALTDDIIDFGREIIALEPDSGLWCDVREFQAKLHDCRQHGHDENQVCPRCQSPLEQAASLYTDDFMAGFSLRDSAEFDDWQFFQADRLRSQLASVLERLVSLNEGPQDYSTAIDNARRWLTLDFLNEAAHRSLIRLYALNDQRNAALRQYRECVRILDEELGVPPLEETAEVYNAAKENKLEVLRAVQPQSMEVHHPPGKLVVSAPRSTTEKHIPLVGRSGEMRQLSDLYANSGSRGAFAVVTGEAGIGKTRLAQEFNESLHNLGASILTARCYAGESNLAYTPLIDLLRQGIGNAGATPWWQGLNRRLLSEVSLIVPELADIIPDLPAPQQTEVPAAQTRFYESVCQVLEALVGGNTPGVMFIDNLEWADDSSLELLAYLARRLPRRPIFLLICWQTEASPQMTILEQVLTDAVRQGYGLHLSLSPLQPAQVHQIIEQAVQGETQFKPSFIDQLVNESEGVPYFLVEYLQAALEGEIDAGQTADEWPVPTGLRGMLHNRMANLSGTSLQVLQAAAVIGRTFDVGLLQTASGRTEDEIVRGVEELLSRSLIREIPSVPAADLPNGAYDFKHDQVRALVLEEISLVRSQLLHRRVASALEEHKQAQTPRMQYGQIAYHY
jgi:DNA-binding SARP family transcriptional activator